MISKIKILLIISITSLILGSILLVIGINYGVSIRGKIIERTLFLSFVISTALGLFISIKNRKKKETRVLILILLSPVIFTILFTKFSSFGILQIGVSTIYNTLNSDTPFIDNGKYSVLRSESLMTNQSYIIKEKHQFTEELKIGFYTDIDLNSAQFLFTKDSLIITNKDERLSVRLED
jgi:hypothetical protein